MILRALGRVFLVVALALMVIFLLVEEDPWVAERLTKSVNAFMSKTYECSFSSRVRSVSLLFGELELVDVDVRSVGSAAWSWRADRARLSWSWFSFALKKMLRLNIDVYEVAMHSTYDNGTVPLFGHIRSFFKEAPSAVPVSLHALSLHHAGIVIENQATRFYLDLNLTAQTSTHGWRIAAAVADGDIRLLSKDLLRNLSGSLLYVSVPQGQKSQGIRFSLTGVSPFFADRQASVRGAYASDDTRLAVHIHDSGSLEFLLQDDKATMIADAAIASSIRPFYAAVPSSLKGTMQLSASAQWSSFVDTFDATLSLKGLGYEKNVFSDIVSRVRLTTNSVSGTTELSLLNGLINAQWSYSPGEQKVDLSLTIAKELSYAGWQSKPETQASVTFENGALKGTYTLSLGDATNIKQHVQGTIGTDGEDIVIHADARDATFDARLARRPSWHLSRVVYNEQSGQKAVFLATPNGDFSLQTTYAMVRLLLRRAGIIDIPGEGIVTCTGTYNNALFTGRISMHDANIRIPYTYNLLQSLSVQFLVDAAQRTLSFSDLVLKLYQGEIIASHGYASLDAQGALRAAYIPLRINQTFIGWQKDIVGMISGVLFARYKQGSVPEVNGHLLINRAHIRSNVLGNSGKQQMLGLALLPLSWYEADAALNVAIKTRTPLRIKTNSLETHAKLNVLVSGSLSRPSLAGELDLIGGKFIFPYQPLYITFGRVYFLSAQLDDPSLQVTAQGRIKGYQATMNVTGSVKRPVITFDSSPSLSEGQIISLLVSGSEEGSLFSVMPATIMGQMQNFLFGSPESISGAQRYLKSLFKPFRNIRIVPSFSDQTGRGGLRGALAIEVNDRLRGVIQQNFTLPEDTRYEIDYALSDDSMIRAVKDERGYWGAELETRWKF